MYVFDTCLRLLHPFMPFITEALWQQLPRKGEALMVAPWPKVDDTPLAVDESAINRYLNLRLHSVTVGAGFGGWVSISGLFFDGFFWRACVHKPLLRPLAAACGCCFCDKTLVSS